ncbi:LysR substrate-binding domain-containing protein [Zeimonas arvi]|uniref:LysR family transcriptional regulator n=1 Tax=Zeimonas arvi TaxID=2498847 RepID=A0A5C8NUD6_9BURK|nr:LysR substrate-binding domain-containing protein [Zeimonas arvi]TXL64785.1 LysR family transcriptional regulator [Zeimonas arvi]
MNVTLRQFRYFIAVADCASVSAAARQLNISQSAITAAVQQLEDDLGVHLFERSSRGVMLTPDGHRFLASARRVIAAVADATHALRAQPKALEGQLSIGVTPLVAGYYLSELLSRFTRACPAVEVRVLEDEPRFLEHLLINGEVDVAIMISSALVDRQALSVEILTRSPNRVWLASSHPLAARDDVSLAEVAAEPLIVLAADRIDEVMRAVWQRYQLSPRALLRTSSLEAVRSLVGTGMGVTVLPDFVYRPWSLEADRVEARPLRDGIATLDIGLVWRRGLEIDPVTVEFIEVAREQSAARARRASPGAAA